VADPGFASGVVGSGRARSPKLTDSGVCTKTALKTFLFRWLLCTPCSIAYTRRALVIDSCYGALEIVSAIIIIIMGRMGLGGLSWKLFIHFHIKNTL